MTSREHKCPVCGYVRSENAGTNRAWIWCRKSRGWVCDYCCLRCEYYESWSGLFHCKWDPEGRSKMRQLLRDVAECKRKAMEFEQKAAAANVPEIGDIYKEISERCRMKAAEAEELYEAYNSGTVIGCIE